MTEDSYRQKLVKELINRERWADFLRRFMDVLRINIFVVDYEGKVFIRPHEDSVGGRYGSEFLTSSFGFDFSAEKENFLDDFVMHGSYLESKDPFDFHVFAIPVKVEDGKVLAYVIVGPVILNKRWQNDDYVNMANQLEIKMEGLMDMIHEIRVVSFVAIKAILDLLSEVVKDIVELNFEKKKLHQTRLNKQSFPEDITKTAQELYATIHLDELLVTILDVALSLTAAEGGSIMVLDEKSQELVVKVSRGIDADRIESARQKVGEGIAGIAAQENKPFIISRSHTDNRISHLLKRPDITQSAVIPLAAQEKVFGVLNLHTKAAAGQIDANVNNLKHLARLVSTAILSI